MRRILLFALFVIAGMQAQAQTPQKFNYQGIARNASGGAMSSANISLRLTIHNLNASGATVYQETHTVTTNAYGLYNVAVGGGTVTSGTFANINWGTGNKFLEVEVDPAGGSSYTSLGTNQLLSVPYSLMAGGVAGGTVNYLPKYMNNSLMGNSAIYQTLNNKVGINSTLPFGTLTIATTADSVIVFGQNKTATVFGSARFEYAGTTDVTRVGLLSTTIRSTTDVWGIGMEGAGSQVGVLGYGASASATQVSALEGDAYGSGSWSIGVLGSGNMNGSLSPTYAVGVYGMATNGLVNYAGYFQGNVSVLGSLSKSSGTFKIDHPLDPDNKYLYHSFVESPDMMNIYNGNVTTDASGTAVVVLPTYFEALNKDFRYQLTVIGTFAQAIVSKEVAGNQFEIKTNQPNVKVSWQVTGVRHDAWADANRVVPEVEKESFNKGKYLTAKALGKPESRQIGADVRPTSKANDANVLPAPQPTNE